MSVIDYWYNNKKKTYWKTWEVRDTQFPDGSIAWTLFILEEGFNTPMHYGVEGSVEEAKEEIKWAIGTYLKSNNLL